MVDVIRHLSTVVAVIGIAGCSSSPAGPGDDGGPLDDVGWLAYSESELDAIATQDGGTFVEVHADSIFRLGLLHRSGGVSSPEVSWRESAVYQVLSGEGMLTRDSSEIELGPGSIVFVRGEVDHLVRATSSELRIAVMFRRVVPFEGDPAIRLFTEEELAGAPLPEENVWTQLFEGADLSIGLYQLPKGGIDDRVLSHDFPEFKTILGGGGRFDVGEGGAEVAPGTITLIGAEVRHRFRRVSDDLDVLVIWAS